MSAACINAQYPYFYSFYYCVFMSNFLSHQVLVPSSSIGNASEKTTARAEAVLENVQLSIEICPIA